MKLKHLIEAKIPPISPQKLVAIISKQFPADALKKAHSGPIKSKLVNIKKVKGQKISLTVISAENIKIAGDVARNIGKYGWFVSYESDIEYFLFKEGVQHFYFEPNYEKPASNPGIAIHVTDKFNLDNILKKGILPKTGSWKHGSQYPSRVYFALNNKTAKFFAELAKIAQPVFLRVDTSKLKNAKFYYDQNMIGAIWTYAHIPPSVIEVEPSEI